jgi:hypothetical protein
MVYGLRLNEYRLSARASIATPMATAPFARWLGAE